MIRLPSWGGVCMHAYSQDLRDRVLRALDRGDRPVAIAERFEVSRAWGYQVKQRFKREGVRHSVQMGGHRTSCLAPWESTLREWIKKPADLTLEELRERLSEQGISIKVPALWHQLDTWNLSLKKPPARQRARTRRRTRGARRVERTSAHG